MSGIDFWIASCFVPRSRNDVAPSLVERAGGEVGASLRGGCWACRSKRSNPEKRRKSVYLWHHRLLYI